LATRCWRWPRLRRERIAAFAAHADRIKFSAKHADLLRRGVPGAEIAPGWLGQGAALAIITDGGAGAEAFGRIAVSGHKAEVADLARFSQLTL
jgi:fructokinase